MSELKETMCAWRHQLHSHPETAFEEFETAKLVASELEKMGLDVHTGIGGTGIIANLKCGEGKKIIALRADMDAINLTEEGNPAYKSQIPGKMHGCGHDGHTATLLGAAKLLSESRDFDGTVRFLFQPAEEPGRGAAAMLNDGLLERFPIDEIYGLHNLPSLPAGTLHTRAGGIMASEDNFTITIRGIGGHASSPHLGIDPLVCAAEIIMALQTIPSRNAGPLEQCVVSCTEIHTDGGHNAIPSTVTITGDTRSCTPKMQKLIEDRMRSICEGVCAMNGAKCDFLYTHEFRPTVNDPACVEAAVAAATSVLGAKNVSGECEPWMASEDFGTFLEKIPGCYLFLGSAKKPEGNIPPHNAQYDYNDDVLETGAQFFAALVRQRLHK